MQHVLRDASMRLRSRERRCVSTSKFETSTSFFRMDSTWTKQKSNSSLIGYALLETWKRRSAKMPFLIPLSCRIQNTYRKPQYLEYYEWYCTIPVVHSSY